VLAGTRLRLDQTDFTATSVDWNDAWVEQRFLVLDGPLIGDCVAFGAGEPGLPLSWVPAAIAPDEADA
jgi:hypothetical protein